MIRKDFEKGGFPLNGRCPVLCIDANHNLQMAYTRYDLVAILKSKDVRCCYGVWPGKKETDSFFLDPKVYAALPIPPESNKDIDNAGKITAYMEGGKFSKIVYGFDHENVEGPDFDTVSRNPDLFDYIKKAGLKFSLVFE